MRNVRRLPPLLRVATILGLLFVLAAFTLMGVALVINRTSTPQSSASVDANRLEVIAINLVLLSLACTSATQTYSTRFRGPGGGPFPLDSWQSQVRAIALAAALPVCALTVAVLIPPTLTAFAIVFPISIIGAVVLMVVWLSVISGRQAVD